jgi:hypothetical protein
MGRAACGMRDAACGIRFFLSPFAFCLSPFTNIHLSSNLKHFEYVLLKTGKISLHGKPDEFLTKS